MIKRNAMFDRFEEEEVVMFRDMCGKTRAERSRVVVPVLEEQGVRACTWQYRNIIAGTFRG